MNTAGARIFALTRPSAIQSDRLAETARQILATIKDDDRREDLTARLVMHLAGAAPMPRTAAPARTSGSGRSATRRSSAASTADETEEESRE